MSTRAASGPSSSGHCRSCGARVEWLPHHVTKNLAPIETAPRTMLGNIAVTADGEYFIVPAGEGEFVNHFATCPAAAEHHKAPA